MYYSSFLIATVMISSVLAQSATTCTTPYQALAKEPSLSIAKQTVDAAGLKDVLDDPELDATLFLPTNDGFATFMDAAGATLEDLLNYQGLENLLKYHVHLIAHNISDFEEGEVVDMINGDTISVNFVKEGDPKYAGCSGHHLHIGSHAMTDSDPSTCDIQACKAIIHLVDYPLLPEDDSITASFPDIAIRSSTGNEDEESHDHEDHEISGDASKSLAAPSTVLGTIFAFLLILAAII